MSDVLVSAVRTLVPVIVGLVAGALVSAGIDVDEGALTTVVDGVLIGAYYLVVRFLEQRVPAFGWLLGVPRAPVYPIATED